MRYLSVCSGIEAASVAWHPLGWQAVAFSEIEKFPSAVLAHHYPTVPNWGDMTRFYEWPEACVCDHGKLDRERREQRTPIRNGSGRPGGDVYADKNRCSRDSGNHDAIKHYCPNCGGATIDLLVGGTPCQSFSVAGLRKGLADPRGNLALTYLAIADRYRPEWLVWENVPGVLSSGDGRDFGAFLGGLVELGYGWAYRVLDAQYFGVAQRRRRVFVVANLRGWQRAAAVLFDGKSLCWDPPPRRETREGATDGLAKSLRGRSNASHREDFDTDIPDISLCLNAGGMGRIDGESETMIPVAYSLRAEGFDASEGGTGRGTPLVPIAIRTANTSANGHGVSEGVAHTIDQAQGQAVARHGMQVRRLTPVECARLQGFPDDYLDITYRGKPAADSPKYKALGNSMAVPVMAWIGRRIQVVAEIR